MIKNLTRSLLYGIKSMSESKSYQNWDYKAFLA